MTPDEKLEYCAKILIEKRALREQRAEIASKVKKDEDEMEESIVQGDGELDDLKRKQLRINKNKREASEIAKQIKVAEVSVENVILGLGENDPSQLTMGEMEPEE